MAKRKTMKLARLGAGLTQLALAEELGVKERIIMQIETGRTNPMPSVALRIAKILSTDISHLFPDLGLGVGND